MGEITFIGEMSNVLAPIRFSELQKEQVEGRGEIVKYISGVQDCNYTEGYVQFPWYSEMGFYFYRHGFKTTFYLFETNV